MRILWLCNVIIPKVAVKLGESAGTGGGWITGLSDIFDKREDIELCLVAPYLAGKELTYVKWGIKSEFYGFQKRILDPCIYDESVEDTFRNILKEVKPDIVHIFGTEFPHSLSMVRAYNRPERTIVHIQGLISFIAMHYEAYLPSTAVNKSTFRDFIKRDNILAQKKKFEKRGIFEIEALKNVNNVFYRTDWDKACVKMINSAIKLHYAGEMLREEFYTGNWSYETCEKKSIFVSQGNYPVKGLHLMLNALNIVKKKYPNVKLYISGDNIYKKADIKSKLRQSYYSVYIEKLIKELDLESNIEFTGSLTAEEMKRHYLECNVFVSSSSIENSPNSIGEAMLLGVPIIASYVGGCSSLLEHKKEGILYQADAYYMLAAYICQLFEDKDMAMRLGEKAALRAKNQYERETIIKDIFNTYKGMIGE